MFYLVKFDNEHMMVCDTKKLVATDNNHRDVVCRYRGASYRAKLLCSHKNSELLKLLLEDIHKKVMSICIERYLPRSLLRRRLFVNNNDEYGIPEETDRFESSFKPFEKICPEDCLDQHYEILEVISSKYDNKNLLSLENSLIRQEKETREINLSDQYCRSLNEDLLKLADETLQGICLNKNNDKIPQLLFEKSVIDEEDGSKKNYPNEDLSFDQYCGSLNDENLMELTDKTLHTNDKIPQLLVEKSVIGQDETKKIKILQNINLNEDFSKRPENRYKKRVAKKHACIFCQNLVTNLPRHMRMKHGNEELVMKAVDETKKAIQQKENNGKKSKSHCAFEELRKMGDFQYNHNTKKIIHVRESNKPEETYSIACPNCKGYYSKKNFNHHFKQYCKPENYPKNRIGTARVMGKKIHPSATEELVNEFFPYFTKQDQLNIIVSDETVVGFANKLLKKYVGSGKHIHVASQLRLLADIFNNAKSINNHFREVKDMFHPKHYETVISAIKLRCGFENGVYKCPTTATNSCTLIGKVVSYLKCEALKRLDKAEQDQYSNFEYLLEHSQNLDITRVALDNRTQHQRQKLEVLPTTQEIKELLLILKQELNETYEKALIMFNEETYSNLVKAILAYIMVFNRKRPGDCHKTQILEYKNLARVDKEHLDKLANDKKVNALSFGRFVAQGKLNKKASNIIPKEIEQAINYILQHRSEIGIEANNKYIFAVPNPKRIPFFRADDALKQICKNRGLQYSKFSANKLRKHLATCTSTLPKDVQAIISDFMGHTMGVHKDVYQQKQVQTDIVTMGTILMEAGGLGTNDKTIVTNITNANNSTIPPKTQWLISDKVDAIESDDKTEKGSIIGPHSQEPNLLPVTSQDFTPLPGSSNLSRSGKASDHLITRSSSNFQSEEILHDLSSIAEVDESGSESSSPPPMKIRKLSVQKDSDSDYCPLSTESLDDKRAKRKKRIFKTLNKPKIPWTTPERVKVRTLFDDYINKLQVPPIHDVQNIVKSNVNMSIERQPASVQSWIAAEIQRRKGTCTQRWTTPQKHRLRERFGGYFKAYKTGRNSVRTYPSTFELQKAIDTLPEFKGTCTQRWTTPQKHRLRERFGGYFKAYKTGRNSVRTYPSTFELQKAIDTLPEFKGKSAATLRSKIQHEYRKIE